MTIFIYFLFLIIIILFIIFLPIIRVLITKKHLVNPNFIMANQDRIPFSALEFFEDITALLTNNDFEKLIDIVESDASIYVRLFVNRSIGDTASATCHIKQNNVFYSFIEFRTQIKPDNSENETKYLEIITTNYKNKNILNEITGQKIFQRLDIDDPENLYIFQRKQVLLLLQNKKGAIPSVSDEIKKISNFRKKELVYQASKGLLYSAKDSKFFRYTLSGAFTFTWKSIIFRRKAFEGVE